MAIVISPEQTGIGDLPRSDVLTESAAPMREFILDVRRACETETTINRILEAIQGAQQRLLSRPDALEGLSIDLDAFRSWKVYTDPVHLFCINVGHQKPRHRRGVHDHGELGWAVYGLHSGAMGQQLYDRLDDGSQAGHAELRPRPFIRQAPGDATIVSVGMAHAPINDSDSDAWTVVIRSRDLATIWRNWYDVEKHKVFRMCKAGD